MNLNISVATVTYGDRLKYLFPVVEQLLKQDFNHIYVYCNGVSESILSKIKNKFNSSKITVLYSEENKGSAGGYNELISYLSKLSDIDRLLLLDDDNLVPIDCFKKIVSLSMAEHELYYFHRPDRNLPKQAKELKDPQLILGEKNSFLGRSIFKKENSNEAQYSGDLLAAPYGGLLLNRKALVTGILPKKELYLYADDYEYTYRLVTQHDFIIKFSEVFCIEDLEKSYHLRKGTKLFSNRYSNATPLQLYYSLRNNTWFGLTRSSSKFKYMFNLLFYSFIFLTQFTLTLKINNVQIYIKAVLDGIDFYKNEKRPKS